MKLLNEEIYPGLEKLLRAEKRIETEIECLSRIVIAYEYTRNKDILGGSDTNIEAKKNEIQDLEMISERLKEEITHLKEDIKRTISDK